MKLDVPFSRREELDLGSVRGEDASENPSLACGVTLGIFLLRAVRDPVANRSLIAFGGWANLAHATVMAAQEYRNVIERQELFGVVVFRNRRCSAGRADSCKAVS